MTLWRIRTTIDDRPGYLSVLTASLALRGVNILTVQVHTTEAGAVDDFLVDAPDQLTEADLLAAVERGRGRDCWLTRSEARGLVDQPTRALGLGTRLVQDPEALDEALRRLLDAETVTWRPVSGPSGSGLAGRTLRLPDRAGGEYEITRSAPGFTPAEYARAQALVELASVARMRAQQVSVMLPDGAELTVRPAGPEDLPAVRRLHQRCSDRTRQLRYLGGAAVPGEERLRRLLVPARGITLLAIDTSDGGTPPAATGADADPFLPTASDQDRGQVVAMGNLLGEGDEAEVALLVRDDWQRRGVGTALLRRLADRADRAGYAGLVAHIGADNGAMLRTVARLARPARIDRDGAVRTVTVALAAPRGRSPVAR